MNGHTDDMMREYIRQEQVRRQHSENVRLQAEANKIAEKANETAERSLRSNKILSIISLGVSLVSVTISLFA